MKELGRYRKKLHQNIGAYAKTKKINLKQTDTNSVVSISELEDMQDSLEKQKKSRRKKPKSERNSISLNFT